MVVVTILTLAGGGLAAFSRIKRSTDLAAGADLVKFTLEKARLSTLAKEDGAGYSVKINPTALVWFKGQTYNPADPANKLLGLPGGVAVSGVDLENGGDMVFFSGLTGTTSPGTITLTLASDETKTAALYLNRAGSVYFSSDSVLAKPTADSRHLHFDLGWSIKGAVELKFVFLSKPKKTEKVAMAPFFNADLTSFDYTGQFTVDKENQEIRVHTHFLDAANTILSIGRDGAKNTQPVEIYIDGKLIATYAADGSAAAGPFGGVMTAP